MAQYISLTGALNQIEESLWNLEAVLLVRKRATSPEVEQRIVRDLASLKRAVVDAQSLSTLPSDTEASLVRLGSGLVQLEEKLSVAKLNIEEAESQLRTAKQEVRNSSSRLWRRYREMAGNMASSWRELNTFVLISCCLVAFLAFMLRSYHRDLMDRREAEHALRESEDRYRSLVEVSPDAILVHREGRLLFVNSTAAKMFGADSAHAMLSMTLPELGYEAEAGRNQQLRRLDGSPLDAEIVATNFAFLDSPATQMVVRDMTMIHQQQEQLAATEQRYRALFENVSEGIYRSSEDGRILDTNPALVKMLGYESIEELQATLIDRDIYVDPTDRRNAVEELRATGVLKAHEIRLRRRDGTVLTVLDNARVLRRPDNTIECYEGTLTDISHLKQIEQALVEARDEAVRALRLKSEFLTNMSHEIRTPMNGIIGMTDLLRDTPLNVEQQEFCEAVGRSAQYLMNIINDLLDFSKIEAGKLEIESVDFRLRESVEDVLELLAESAQAKDLEIAANFDPLLPEVMTGAPYRIQQVLTNLVGNAIKFTDVGEVRVQVSVIGQTVGTCEIEVSVFDTGVGVDPRVKPQLFQPFIQGDGSTTRKYGGAGLGLAISRQLVEMMGGRIGLESRSGGGSRFWFRLPLKVIHTNTSLGVGRGGGAWRAVVCVPSDLQRENVIEILRQFGYTAKAARTGQELVLLAGEALSQGQPFAAVVVHDRLPDMTAAALAQALRNAGYEPDKCAIRLVRMRDRGISGMGEHYLATISDPVRRQTLMESLDRVEKGGLSIGQVMSLSQRLVQEAVLTPVLKQRVLIAEDNAINQRVATRMLEKLGIEADIVENGRRALEAVQNINYPLVLMDCQMPEMDGFQATAAIRAWEATGRVPRIPIVAMTAHAMPGDRERCLDSGMDDYISKPISLAGLETVLSKWMEIQRAERNVKVQAAGS